jgi:hypothetical protein
VARAVPATPPWSPDVVSRMPYYLVLTPTRAWEAFEIINQSDRSSPELYEYEMYMISLAYVAGTQLVGILTVH